MAWRIHDHILRGQIDNRVRGRVTGRVWIEGVTEPISLDLAGDCQPDLAGCLLRFENPKPIALTTPPLAPRQRGKVGQLTAARKVRLFDVPIEEAIAMLKAGGAPPEHLASGIYLEWFSKLSGCVVIESADYRLEISEPVWRFSADELCEREHLAAEAGAAPFALEVHEDGTTEKWDEFRCEQFLRESDARTERYGALLKKYADHPDADRIIAREMGWDWLEEAFDAEGTAAEASSPAEAAIVFEETDDFEEPEPDPSREGIDWIRRDDGRIVHPLQADAQDLLHSLCDELKSSGHFPDCDDQALCDFVGHFMNLTAKLAGALGSIARGWIEIDPGMTVARLKRILSILNEALKVSDRVAEKDLSAERRAHYRAGLFALREAIVALIARLRR